MRAAQYFISEGNWDDAAILAAHQRLVDATLGEDDGVLLIDGSDVPKQGRHSVGVVRQWCGATGKRDNCQAGVYLGYASRQGYTLLDRRLYLPEAWFTDAYRDRWRACGIPDGTPFQTKHDLAAALVDGVMAERRVRARWLACDEGFGNNPALLDRIAAHGLWYLAEVPCDAAGLAAGGARWARPGPARGPGCRHAAPAGRGRPPAVERLHPDSPPRVRRGRVGGPGAGRALAALSHPGGEQGAAGRRVRRRCGSVQARDGLPGPEGWLVVRRTLPTEGEPPVYKYYLSNAPAETPAAALVRVSGLRWPIEACFTEGKGEVGLDHYEVRTWRGWHHHLTLVILAHFFLMRLVLRLNRREGGLRPGGGRRRSRWSGWRRAPIWSSRCRRGRCGSAWPRCACCCGRCCRCRCGTWRRRWRWWPTSSATRPPPTAPIASAACSRFRRLVRDRLVVILARRAPASSRAASPSPSADSGVSAPARTSLALARSP